MNTKSYMKILYVITKSEIGGAQTHVFDLARHIQNRGHKVAVMAYPGGPLEKIFNSKFLISNQFSISNFQTSEKIKFYPNRYFRNSYNPFLGIGAMREIKKAVKDFKPDIAHCHSSVAGFWARLAIRNNVPTVFTAHGWAFTEGAPFLRKCLAILIEKIAGKFCSKIICVSDFDKNLALKYKIASSDKITVIHNGVEVSVEQTRNDTQNRREIRIVFVGRLAQQKDPLLLLESFNNLPSELKNKSQVSIIGEGPKRKELEEFIKKNKLEEKVKLLGSISREKIFEALRESDIFVLTSNWEGFPITILEAMSCGLPVIASDVGGVREAVDKEVGFLIERGDKEALKKALMELIENPDLREKMGQNAQKRAEDNFSLDKMLRETEKVYNIA